MKYLLILFFGFLSFKVCSQNSFYNKIGKNRIQYKSFKWNVVHTNNFEIYYSTDLRGLKYFLSDINKTVIIDTPKLDLNFYLPFRLIKLIF